MTKDKTPEDNKPIFFDDLEWGNQELPNLSDIDILDPKINIKLANKKKAKDPKWREQNAKNNADPVIRAKRKASMPDQSGENNPFWKRSHTDEVLKKISDLKKGKTAHNKGTKHTDEALKKMRKPRSEKGKQAIKEAIRLARAKPENFSDCSHCGLLHISNQNYKKYHGDACWLKGKSIVGCTADQVVVVQVDNQIDLEAKGYSVDSVKTRIKKNDSMHYKKLFWKLITV